MACSVMKEGMLEQFRRQLVHLRSELQQLENEYEDGAKTVVLDQTRVGRLTRMDAMQAQQMALESARRRQQQII